MIYPLLFHEDKPKQLKDHKTYVENLFGFPGSASTLIKQAHNIRFC
jgi:hypothetical protein